MAQSAIETDRLPRVLSLDYQVMVPVEFACPVIIGLVKGWRVYLSNDDRARLIEPLQPRLAGTRSTKAVEERRAFLVADWLVRVNVPAWLRLARLDAHADALEALPEITTVAQILSIRGPIEAAREHSEAARATAGRGATAAIYQVWKDIPRAVATSAARDAAMFAAEDIIWEAARMAARDAVWVAATDAAKAAGRVHPGREAARDAQRVHARERERFSAMAAIGDADGKDEWGALSAARSAERDALAPVIAAAKIAARDALQPTVQRLQLSLLDLVSRMLEMHDAGGAGSSQRTPQAATGSSFAPKTKLATKGVIAGFVSRLFGG